MLERVEGHIYSLRVATDEKPHLGPDTVRALGAAVEHAVEHEDVRVLLLEGGTRHFCAGASRASLLAARSSGAVSLYAVEMPRLLLSIPVPTVAVMAGHAIGGGLALGLWCDAVVLAEESLYGANFMALGFTPGMGSTVALEETFGAPLARDLLFSGRLVRGSELAAAAGIGALVGARAEVRERALGIARGWAANERRPLMLLKRTLAGRRRERFERAATEEMLMHVVLFDDPETGARIAAEHAERDADELG
jgi:enoyl-CoA hydratase/carnithine racemase